MLLGFRHCNLYNKSTQAEINKRTNVDPTLDTNFQLSADSLNDNDVLRWYNTNLVHLLSENYFFQSRKKVGSYCTPNVVQTLVFYSRLPGMNRHWVDFVPPLLENYFFQSRKKVGPVIHPTLYKRWHFTVDYRG